MSEQVTLNNATGTVTTQLEIGVGSVEVSAGLASQLDAGVNFAYEYILLTINAANAPTQWEIVKCTGVSGNLLTIERGLEGTDDAQWIVGSVVSARITAGTLERARRQVERLLYDEDGALLLGESGEVLLGAEIE